MPAWWTQLSATRQRAIAGGLAVIVVASAFVITFAVTGGDDTPAEATPVVETEDVVVPIPDSTEEPEPDPTALPPDKDEYCPAFDDIRSGGFQTTPDEEGSVDLDELGRKFDEIIGKYKAAERVSPQSLRDDYAKALGYLREGRKAVDSRDVELLKALVKNLDTLNASMDAILTKSKSFCG